MDFAIGVLMDSNLGLCPAVRTKANRMMEFMIL